MFKSVEDVIAQLSDQEYICDKQIATVVFLAQQLDKPVRPQRVVDAVSRLLTVQQSEDGALHEATGK